MARGSPDWLRLAPQKGFMQLLREGNAFYAYITRPGAAGNYVYLQIFNPAGSGINALVKGVGYRVEAANRVHLMLTQVQMSVFGGFNNCRYAGLPNSRMQSREENRAWFIDQNMGIYSGLTTWQFDHELWLWLPEGWGLTLSPAAMDIDMEGQFYWFEFVSY